MSCKSKKITPEKELEKTAEAIYSVVMDLGEQGVNPGCIAACLTMHATRLSFATCEDPKVVFKNILATILHNIPNSSYDFDEELEDKITHASTTYISN